MLQQILKDMYIEPDLLEALNEDQKKTLFLKMRQEQVRRWKEREEKMEKEEVHRPKPKTGNSKTVSWLLGRDGDVQVIVIGEVDELKSSKLIYTGLGERNTSSLHNNSRPCGTQATTLKSNLINRSSTDSVRSGRENHPPKTQAGIQLNLKDNTEEVRTSPPLQVATSEQKPSTDNAPQPREPQEDAEPGRSARAPSPPPPAYRPHLRPVSMATPSAPLSAASLLKAQDRSSSAISSSSSRTTSSSSGSSSSSSGSSSSSSISGGGGASSGLLGGPAHLSAASLLKTSDRSGSGGGGGGGLSTASLLKTPDRTASASGSSGGSSSSSSSGSGSGVLGGGLLGGPAHLSATSLLKTSDRSGGSGAGGGVLGGPGCRMPTAQPQDAQSSRGKEFRVVSACKRAVSVDEEGAASTAVAAGGADACVGRGRVAQLMKTFSVCGEASAASAASGSHMAPPARSSKPPIPSKPSHLRLQQSASLR